MSNGRSGIMGEAKIDEYLQGVKGWKRDAFLELSTEVDKDFQQGSEIESIIDMLIEHGSDVYSARLFVQLIEELNRQNIRFWSGWPEWVGGIADEIGRFPVKDEDIPGKADHKTVVLWQGWAEWASNYASAVVYGLAKQRLLECLQLTSLGAVCLAAAYFFYGNTVSVAVKFAFGLPILTGIAGFISASFSCLKYRQSAWPRLPLYKCNPD